MTADLFRIAEGVPPRIGEFRFREAEKPPRPPDEIIFKLVDIAVDGRDPVGERQKARPLGGRDVLDDPVDQGRCRVRRRIAVAGPGHEALHLAFLQAEPRAQRSAQFLFLDPEEAAIGLGDERQERRYGKLLPMTV